MSHETQVKSNEWYTPKYIFDALDVVFTCDVASPKDKTFCSVPARSFLSELSLENPWTGFVWMNPPFGNQQNKFIWIQKFIDHGNGVALMPDRTSAPWWQHFANHADAVLFVNGKIKFIDHEGNEGKSPSTGTTLFAKGSKGVEALRTASKNGLGKLYQIRFYQTPT